MLEPKDRNMSTVAIIGGGLMGCSAAWQLARSGVNIILIEQQPKEYLNGSSYGEARVTRSLGVKEDLFTYVKEVCVEEVKLLIDYLNDMDDERHSFKDIYNETPVTYLYDQKNINEVEHFVFDEDYEVAWNKDEAYSKFGMHVSDKIVIREFKEGSGTLNPKELIRKLKRGIEILGGEVLHETEVSSIKTGDEQLTIELNSSNRSSIRCSGLIIAAGPYTAETIKNSDLQFDRNLQPKRMYLTFFQIRMDYWKSLSESEQKRFVSFYPVADFNSEVFYSMIEKFIEETPLIKIGGHLKRFEIKNKHDIWEDEVPSDEIDWSLDASLRYLRALGYNITKNDLKYSGGYSCVYTLTENEIPIVSQISQNPKVVIIAGLSGIGAKGSLAYGKIAADYFLNQESADTKYDKVKKTLAN